MYSAIGKKIVTKKDIINGLTQMGLRSGMIVEVHSSLSSFGYVVGGAQTIVDALMEVITPAGTIIMPYQTCDNSEPSLWVNPPVEPESYKYIRENMPAYSRSGSDARNMGSVVENFRKRSDIVFSNHPQNSYIAWGQYAKALCNRQSLHFSLSQESPCARLYELKGFILLLGVNYDRATAMHLAEYRTECRPIVIQGSKVELDGYVQWKKYFDLDFDSDIFNNVGKVMEDKKMVAFNTIGESKVKLFRADMAIDEATAYFEKFICYDAYR